MLRSLLTKAKDTPAGFLTITLHAHLPWVVNHGTWPHGIEWLHEAAAETYLPFLRVLSNLERDGIPANFNINLSPILLEQLAHPFFIAESPSWASASCSSSAANCCCWNPPTGNSSLPPALRGTTRRCAS